MEYDVGKTLTSMPPLPSETTEEGNFIGATVDEVMDNAELSKDQKQDAVRGTKSEKGERYDPNVHSYPPRQTLLGMWKKRRISTKSKDSAILPNAEYRNAAENAAGLYATLNFFALGEGAERDDKALVTVIDSFEQYYREKGIQKLPVWAGMMVGLGSYTVTVASKKKPRERVKGWFKRLLEYAGFEWESDDEDAESTFDESGNVVKKGWFGD